MKRPPTEQHKHRMRIALLAHALRSQGGLLRGHGFISSLIRSAPQHEYLITVPAGCGYEDISLPANGRFHFCENRDINKAFFSRVRIEFSKIPSVLRSFKADVVFGMGNHGYRNIDCPQVIWISNGYLVYPQKHFPSATLGERLRAGLQRLNLARVLRCADLLFCQTPVMQRHISDYYGYEMEKIHILPNALPVFLRKVAKEGVVTRPHDVAKDKFNCLILTKYYPHKNPEMVLDACLESEERFDDIRFITTISEGDNVHSRAFIRRLDANPQLKGLIQNIGPIAYEKLESYYRNVQLVVMPTLMESFSVTYLEAMYFGVPVLTTDLDFAHYICGDAAVYYDPWRPESLVEKLVMLKSDSEVRRKLVEAGYKQLKKFSFTWDDIVKTAVGQLERLMT